MSATDLAQIKSKNNAKELELKEKQELIARLHDEQANVDKQLAGIAKDTQVHDGKMMELSGKFEAVVTQMMNDQKAADVEMVAQKEAVVAAKKALQEVSAAMITGEVEAKSEVSKLEVEKEKCLAAITKLQMEAAAKALKIAEQHAGSTTENWSTVTETTTSIYAARENAAVAQEAKAEVQQQIADAVAKVHMKADEEASETMQELAGIEDQISAEYAKTSELVKQKAAKFQIMVEGAAAGEKEKASAAAAAKVTAELQKELTTLERQVTALVAQRGVTLKEQIKATAMACAKREQMEAQVSDAKLGKMADEAEAHRKEQKAIAGLEKQKNQLQAKITEVQAESQKEAVSMAKDIVKLRSEVAVKNAEVEALGDQYRSNRNELKAAAAKLVIAQPDAQHRVPMTPAKAADAPAGKKRAREE